MTPFYLVDVFTTEPFTGNPPWWWLATAGRLTLDAPTRTFSQEIDGRVLPVEVRSERGRVIAVSMVQADPVFGAVVGEVSPLASALDLGDAELSARRLQAQVVSTGVPHLLVPVRDLSLLSRPARPRRTSPGPLLRPERRDRRGPRDGECRGTARRLPRGSQARVGAASGDRRAGRRDGTAEPDRSAGERRRGSGLGERGRGGGRPPESLECGGHTVR